MKRRSFLEKSSAASFGGSTALSTLFNLGVTRDAFASGVIPANDHKSMVCIFFAGGLDSYNLLIPSDDDRYEVYEESRGGLAIRRDSAPELDLSDAGLSNASHEYILHPQCRELAALFDQRKLSFVANVGTLVQPTNKVGIQNQNVTLPLALASHSDQMRQWQTSVANRDANSSRQGWAGRLADFIEDCNGVNHSLMNVSLSGNNVFQVGADISPFSLSPGEEFGLSGPAYNSGNGDLSNITNPLILKNSLHQKLHDQVYERSLPRNTYASLSKESLQQQNLIQRALNDLPDEFDGAIPQELKGNSSFSRRMLEVLKLISVRQQLGLRRQIFFVQFGGWDMHGDLLGPFASRIREVSRVIGAFQSALDTLMLSDSVLGFTASDFARTLRTNGSGSDHAWGGPQFVFGGNGKANNMPYQPENGALVGGKVFGEFPDLTIGGDDDFGGGGRIIPKHSTEQYYLDLIKWFGVNTDTRNAATLESLEGILPNIGNFLDPSGNVVDPLGMIKEGNV